MLFAAISLPLHNNMTKIVHEFCGICIQRRYIAGCSSGVWGGGLRFGEESCLCGSSYTLGMLHLFCIARHSLLVVGQGCGLQPFAACSAAGSTKEQPRSALRLFFASRFARLRGIAAQAKKTAAVKGNGCRAPCSLSGFLHHKTPCGKYLRKKYHTMVLPVTQV